MKSFELPPLKPPLEVHQDSFHELEPQDEPVRIGGAFLPIPHGVTNITDTIVVNAPRESFEFRPLSVLIARNFIEITVPRGESSATLPFMINNMKRQKKHQPNGDVLSDVVGRLIFEPIGSNGTWLVSCPEKPELQILRPYAFSIFTEKVVAGLVRSSAQKIAA